MDFSHEVRRRYVRRGPHLWSSQGSRPDREANLYLAGTTNGDRDGINKIASLGGCEGCARRSTRTGDRPLQAVLARPSRGSASTRPGGDRPQDPPLRRRRRRCAPDFEAPTRLRASSPLPSRRGRSEGRRSSSCNGEGYGRGGGRSMKRGQADSWGRQSDVSPE